jgi:hypothetical protein
VYEAAINALQLESENPAMLLSTDPYYTRNDQKAGCGVEVIKKLYVDVASDKMWKRTQTR